MHPVKVVILDDNRLVCDALRRTIRWEALGCELRGTEHDGEAGWALIEREGPLLVIADIRMPHLDGLELAERVRQRRPAAEVIIITGHDEFDYARRALRLGVADIVLKPIDNAELERSIGRTVRRIRRRRSRRGERGESRERLRLSPTVAAALRFLEEHASSQTDLASTAARFRLSGEHLSRQLKRETGHSFVDLLSRIRVRKAISLLQEGRYRVYEVAAMVGIPDYAYFYQVFKKVTGLSPREVTLELEPPALLGPAGRKS